MKSRIEFDRQQLRQEAKIKADEMALNGDVSGATKKFIESIEITPEMVRCLVVEL